MEAESRLIFERLESRLLLAADPALVAAYAFSETSGTTTVDATGHNITGTLTNGPVFAAGKTGNGIKLDGVNDFVNLGNPTALQLTGSMTISAWINTAAFPGDDAAIVSKRVGEVGFQLDTTVDTGRRTIGFKLTSSSGGQMFRFGATTLAANTWYHVAGVYDAATQTMHVYLNGRLDDGALQGTVTSTQRNSTGNVQIGQRPGAAGSFNFNGTIDDVRIYSRALTLAEIQTDMATPVGGPTDATPPTAPTALTATAVSGTQVNLSWTASTDNVAVTGYQVLRDGAQVAVVTTTTYSDSGRTPATTYSYTVRAVDAAGNTSAQSTAASATTPDTLAPTAPTALTATAVSGTQVNLSWTASTDNVAVTGYQVLRDGAQIAVVTTTTYSDTGRSIGTTYSYTVRALDAAGNASAPSTAASATTPDPIAPTPPTGLTATAASGTQVNLSWTASTDNVAVTGYQVLRDGAQVAVVTTTTYSDSGRTPATTYSYTVRAVDAAGNTSAQSTAASATTPDTLAPTAPTALTATAVSGTQVNLSWTASTDNVAVTGYQVLRDGAQIAVVTTTTYSDTGRSIGTTYSYTVRALDAAGNASAPSTAASATTPDPIAPTVAITAPAAGTVSGTVTLTATASDNLGVAGVQFLANGAPIGAEDASSPYSVSWNTTTVANGTYTITARARDTAGNLTTSSGVAVTVSNTQAQGLVAAYAFSETSGTTTVDATGHNITGTLTNGPVFAAGKTGNGIKLDGVNDFVNLGNPTALQLTGSMTISAWINTAAFPGDDAAIVSKRVGEVGFQLDTTLDTGRRTIGFKLTSSSGGQMFRFGATTLAANTWYHVAGVYDAATQTMHVYLNGQLDDGSLVGTVTSTQRNSTGNVQVGQRPGSAGAFNFNGTIDDVRIYSRALTLAEIQSDMSTPIGGPTDATPPTAPTGLTATAVSGTQVNLSWTASTDNVAVTGYQVLRDGAQFAVVTTTTYSDSGRTPATTYSYTVRAVDAAGNTSAQSTAASATTPDTLAPTAPTALTATAASGTQVNLSWTASTDNVAVTGYQVFRDGAQVAVVTTTTYSDSGRTPATTYSYTVRAVDAAGNTSAQSTAASATTPGNDTQAPTVPTGLNANVVSSTQITLSWTASSDNVAVAGYRVFRGGTQVAVVTTTTFVDAGLTPATTYTYTVLAFDAAGNLSAPSSPLPATTPANDTTAPTVAVTAPAAGSVSGTVTVSATASDNVGVVGVQFLLNGAALGAEDTASPYSSSWNTTTVANGTYTLAARARDAAGNVTTSTPVSVTVSNSQPQGLVAAYSFNETTGTNALDSSGNSITGTLTNGAAFAAGRNSNGVRLDGANDFVDLGNPTALQLTGSMTISAWINTAAFPGDDAAIVSKRVGEVGFQLDTTLDTGRRTIGFKLTSSSGGQMFRFGATTLAANTWYHVAGVYDAATQTMHVYLNGQLDDGSLVGTVTSTQRNSTGNVQIGQRPGSAGAFNFNGTIDDVRIYSRALTLAEIQSDMSTPIGGSSDTVPPTVQVTVPANNAQISGIVTLAATASDNVAVGGVQFLVDGVPIGSEDATSPFGFSWDSRTISNGTHALTARARDTSGNFTISAPVSISVANTSQFVNQVLATNFNLPTAMTFLPNGDLLIAELAGTVKLLPAPYTTPVATPFMQLTNVGSAGVQQGLYEIKPDPNYVTNHYIYVFYTLGTPNHDRLSRFTVNAAGTAVITGSEFVIYEDQLTANAEHHGGSINFGNDGKLYLTTGEHFSPDFSQSLTSPRGKILRFNTDGTIPTDNPFYDGGGPNYDAIWALGLRNPYRAYYDAPTGRLYIGDVGGNDYSVAREEINLGVRGANYGWPLVEGSSSNPAYTNPIYSYPHAGRDAAVTVGFVYHGTQYPAEYQGSLFFADYTQNWIKRLTFDASGNVNGVFNFEPLDGSADGPYGDIVYLTEGPDGALYYLDLGYSDILFEFGVSKLRRIVYVNADAPPVVAASASPTSGATPLTVTFSSLGTSDPEGQPLSYNWSFGDGATSTAANPTHTYAAAGTYQARLAASDGVNTSFSSPIAISVGNRPIASILSPTNGTSFIAGDVITFSGSATDVEDGTLPASAYTWNIDFLHAEHVHPGTPITGVTSGTFTIPTEGHDFSGDTRYRITLTVTDTSGLQSTTSVIVTPQKVNLSFASNPPGMTLFLDGIAHVGPFVYDTLVGFHHTIDAPNQSVNGVDYTFASWSDSGVQQHVITVPASGQTLTASFVQVVAPVTPQFVQAASATPQSDQSTVTTSFISAQTAGNINIVAVGWLDATSTIASVVDSAGNTYEVASPLARGTGVSQAVYYARNIKAAPAGTNTLTVTFSTPAPSVDIRAAEYSGIDPGSPLDAATSATGATVAASSGSVTTTSPRQLVFGAGMSAGLFTAAGGGFTTRLLTIPNGEIAEDQFVTLVGNYAATAVLSAPAFWVMQVATFKANGAQA